MAVHVIPKSSADGLEKWKHCERCHSPALYVGGVGDWRYTLVCERCFHIRRGVPYKEVIIPLMMEQYGLSREAALEADERAQKAYMEALARVTY